MIKTQICSFGKLKKYYSSYKTKIKKIKLHTRFKNLHGFVNFLLPFCSIKKWKKHVQSEENFGNLTYTFQTSYRVSIRKTVFFRR